MARDEGASGFKVDLVFSRFDEAIRNRARY
jgi:hypothetical protein